MWTNCNIDHNIAASLADARGGGIYGAGSHGIIMKNCTINENQATTNESFSLGGGIFSYGVMEFSSCMIIGNMAFSTYGSSQGGGIFSQNSESKFTNCTINGNAASSAYLSSSTGGGLYCYIMNMSNVISPSPILINCIVAHDTPNEITVYGISTDIPALPDKIANVTYSLVEGGYEGEGNIDNDPLFVQDWDGTSADLHLQPGSPCIDSGNPDNSYNDGCMPPGLGTVRCDMGAYGGPSNCGWGVEEEPTPTPTTVIPTPTATPTLTPQSDIPTPTPVAIEKTVFEFDQTTVDANGWAEIPGGFTGAKAGSTSFIEYSDNPIPSSKDQKGLSILVKAGEVTFLYLKNPINTGNKPVLLRMTVRATTPKAAVALAVLEGNLNTGELLDGSIATHIPASAASFVDKERQITLVYEPDLGSIITPIIQVSSTAATLASGSDTVYIDRLEVIPLDSETQYSGSLFSSKPGK